MSTKIYNFYRYKAGDIFQLFQWLKLLRSRYLDSVKSSLAGIVSSNGELATRVVEQATRLGVRSPFNIDASVCVFLHEGQIYVQFFGVPDAFLQNADLIDCHYQNQTDRPEDVPDREWSERKRRTEEIFLDGRPSRDGLVFILADENDIPSLLFIH